MRLNKHQREGLAKISDNLATAFAISFVLAGWIVGKMGPKHLVVLLLLFLAFVIFSLMFRSEGENGN